MARVKPETAMSNVLPYPAPAASDAEPEAIRIDIDFFDFR